MTSGTDDGVRACRARGAGDDGCGDRGGRGPAAAADVDVDVDELEPAADGDFEAFYPAHADTVRRALAVTLGDVHVAAEATDEAMTRALAR